MSHSQLWVVLSLALTCFFFFTGYTCVKSRERERERVSLVTIVIGCGSSTLSKKRADSAFIICFLFLGRFSCFAFCGLNSFPPSFYFGRLHIVFFFFFCSL